MLQGVLQRGAVCCKSGVAVFVAGCVARCNAGCVAGCNAGCVAECVLQGVLQDGVVCVLLVLQYVV